VSPVASGSVDTVFPGDDTTYSATFTGPNGTATCTAFVDVQTGGGGGGGCAGSTCPGGLNPPNVTLLRQPGEAPLAAEIFLSEVPYTGFEAGPALTLIFWAAVALFAALAAYYLMGHGALRFLLVSFSDLGVEATSHDLSEITDENDNRERKREEMYGVAYPTPDVATRSGTQYAESTLAFSAPTVPPLSVQPYVVALPRASAPAPVVLADAVTGIPSLVDVIESRAHAAGVLVSPEAVTAATRLSSDRAEALVIFGTILNRAIQTIPRDDGWVMLTAERFETLRDTVMGGTKPRTMHTEPITAAPFGAQGLSASELATVEFVDAILVGNRDTAFGIIRSLEKDGISPTALMTATALLLEKRYRAAPSDGVLHRLVEVFAHALDGSYVNPFTGVKLALAQAFEALS
jgi:hypothetical protein